MTDTFSEKVSRMARMVEDVATAIKALSADELHTILRRFSGAGLKHHPFRKMVESELKNRRG